MSPSLLIEPISFGRLGLNLGESELGLELSRENTCVDCGPWNDFYPVGVVVVQCRRHNTQLYSTSQSYLGLEKHHRIVGPVYRYTVTKGVVVSPLQKMHVLLLVLGAGWGW